MAKINNKSVLIAGAAAGVIMNMIDVVANRVFGDSGLVPQLNAINRVLWANMTAPGRNAQYIAIDFVFAISLVWLYAAVRPRFGAGPKTALRAALYGWVLYNVTQLLFVMMGLFTLRYVATNSVLLFISYAATSLVGAKLYREAGDHDAQGNQAP